MPFLVFVLVLLGACAPASEEPPGPAWAPVDDPAGPAWGLAEDPAWVVAVADDTAGTYTRGVYVRHDDAVLATWTTRAWLDDEGWVPLVLALPRTDGTALGRVDGDTLVLALDGSDEHGCPAHDLEARVTVGPDGVSLALAGIPYLALPRAGTLTVADTDGRWTGDADDLGVDESEVFAGVTALGADALQPDGPLLTAEEPLPWLQIEGHDGFLEVDFDHGCEATPPLLRAHLALTPAGP